ncbi:SDR family oxidoreductase [Lichenihabitans sp. Uapishka_5]|uniref:SDR family oxidoreductase n=1 Tax=Lichenihabitans sp. Uapishka_5 TaxID=3037302 RepID=UPI0029E7D3A9|nr:SDR family oxidoreductase [Lichenihabitans sp. Uapishka_5]MDX7951767.1 SDR family oxidoreductase [Lichenihabitans sp. Uapishka_5]
MHIFVTGATGWVGSAIVADLLAAGHQVTGLSRSADKGEVLAATGARVVHASLDDHAALHEAANAADAVIHTAFNHDFSRFAENALQDRRVIEVLGDALHGSDRPLLVTSGLSGLKRGATEADMAADASPRKSEQAARSLAERGQRVATIRLAPSVHGVGETHGFMPILIRTAREKGVSAYIEEGANCWAGVHRLDAARVYRLALETGVTEPVYHAVAEEAVPFKDIASVIGRRLGLPVESREQEHFGWFAMMARADMSVSAARTRAALGWQPTGPDLIGELDDDRYYAG